MAGTTNMPDLRTRLTLDIGDFTRGLVSARAQSSLFGGTIQDVGSEFKTAGIAMATFATISLFTAGIVVTAFLGAVGVLMTLGVVSAAQAQGVQDAWANVGTHIRIGMQDAARAYIPVLERLAGKVTDVFDRIQPALTQVMDRLAPIFEDMTDTFLDWFGGLVTRLPNQVNEVLAFLAEIGSGWDGMTAGMAQGWDQVVSAFSTDGVQFLNESLPGFGAFVGNILALLAPLIASATDFGGEFFNSLAMVSGAADQLLNTVLPKLGSGFAQVASVLGSIGVGIASALMGVGDPLAHILGDLYTFGQTVAAAFAGLGPTIQGLLESAASAGESLLPVLAAIGRFIVQSGPALVALSQLLASMLGGFIQGLAPLLGDLGPDWAQNFASGIHAITPALTQLATLAGQFVTFLVQGAGLIINALSAVANTVGFLSSIFHDAGVNAGQMLVIGIIAGLGFMISPLTGVMAGLVATVAAYLPRSPAEVGPLSGDGSPDQRGMKLGQMFADGIASSASAVSDAASQLVSGVGLPTPEGGGTNIGIPIMAGGGGATNIYVTVQGSVITDRDLQDSLQKAFLQANQRNAGSTIATSVR